MESTLLVPVDFNVESLITLKLALEKNNYERVKVLLMYARHADDSITDLLFYSPNRIINETATPEFMEAVSIIKNRYESVIADIAVRLFHGVNSSAFNAFAEANRVTEVVLPKTYRLNPPEEGFDPVSVIRKGKVRFTEVDWFPSVNLTQSQQLSTLFLQAI